ncbi:FAD/NAD-linked reductase, dimerisation domain,Reductase, C-terminal,Pyridine nucleotide- [Cinara cedri]|uniref:FAD/NAD-linked reductase, dimerisation domain,Reductase, C-terminal,Pyridine nucleotide n=1 Tax=Cinara cedri TaxID=506608 RepID=A0A5E4LXM6_9HEMI|nr:FAD/NAD-linked reductase, dimerisation domain,Reductase, C-terminal,Pyridine nucleotide- [Cinara cedri]
MGSIASKNNPEGGASDDIIEQIVCKESDIPDNGMKEFEIGKNGNKVLVIKQKNEFFSVGAKCSHYGAPLVKGTLGDGTVRCPWHGACFNLKTGDIEDFPGLDSIPSYNVTVVNGNVKVSAKKGALENSKLVKLLTKRNPEDKRTFIVIGSGPAGTKCAETLRQEGYDGRLVLITKENYLPYDRTKLSKALNSDASSLLLRSQQFYDSGDIEVLTKTSVECIDTNKKIINLSNNEQLSFDAMFIASGMAPRTTPEVSKYENVFTLRTVDDANKISQSLSSDCHLVVIGSSFIGMEVAASAISKVKSVHVIGRSEVPFKESLGKEMGERVQELFESKGVVFHMKASVKNYISYNNRLSEVELSDGQKLKTDVCLMATGSKTNIEFLAGSSIVINSNGTIEVDENLETNVKGIFAGGDVANAPIYHYNTKASLGHWQLATYHGKIAALQMLQKKTPIKSVPFFWTALFGISIRFAGFSHGYTDVLVNGDLENLKVILYYCKGNNVVAIATVGSDPVAAQFAELLISGRTLTKDQAIDNKWLTEEEDTVVCTRL